uniref:translational activator of cytochrome c oxidase 1 n=1 Tax=Scatophagus argus TaxID=75038 RepID=UPI001ED8634E|nr:translational activator of cytochrome c oxidase 1 [Scatophagus argus]
MQTPGPGGVRPHSGFTCIVPAVGDLSCSGTAAALRSVCRTQQMVKEGGPNPDMNVNLAQILEQCRNKNMPKASMETAIKRASKPVFQHTFEARGPGGCLMLIEVLTDSIPHSYQEIKRLLNKNGGMLSEGARHSFNKRGVVAVSGQNTSTERALELAIEVGAEDVQETVDEEEQPLLQFICDVMDMRKVQASLEEMGMQIKTAAVEFVPLTPVCLSHDQMDGASKLIEALSDYPDTVQVWDNIQVDS